jgi:hypothetical protein
MTEMSIRTGGGFRGDGYPPWMSDGLMRRLAKEDLDEAKVDAGFNQLVARATEDWYTRSLLASGALAEARGEYFTHREIMRGEAGRTHQEILAAASAQMDLEDAQQRARLRRSGWTDERINDELSADTSAPSEYEQARAAMDERETRRLKQFHGDLTAFESVTPAAVRARSSRSARRGRRR